MVDIHAHILPGIDDGPTDLEQSLAMARSALEAGIGSLASTPHLRSDFPDVYVGELAERCAALRSELEREGVALEIVCAAEVSVLWAAEASEEELALASYGQRGRDLLLETPWSTFAGLPRLIELLAGRGYRVTLAHPERGSEFLRERTRLQRLLEQGVLLQVNADSLLGPARSPVGRLGRWLCAEGLASAIASDGHRSADWRPVTRLAGAAEAAVELVGADRAEWLTAAAPAAILAGERLPPAPPVLAPRRRGLFRLR